MDDETGFVSSVNKFGVNFKIDAHRGWIDSRESSRVREL